MTHHTQPQARKRGGDLRRLSCIPTWLLCLGGLGAIGLGASILSLKAVIAMAIILPMVACLVHAIHRLTMAQRRATTARLHADENNHLLDTVIVDRGQNERVLKRTMDLLTGVLESSTAGVMAFEAVRAQDGHIVDFRWLLANPAAEQMVGKSQATLLGSLLLDVLPGHTANGLFDAYRAVVEEGRSQHLDVLYDADGLCYMLDISAVKLGDGFAVTLSDIGARKQAEYSLVQREAEATKLAGQLALSEQFARSTVDALSAHIAILDRNGVIVAVNKAWRGFGSVNSKKPGPWDVGANYLKACVNARGNGAEDGIAMADGIRAVISGELPEFSLQYNCHAPGEQRWFLGSVTRFHGDGPVHVVIKHENITSRELIKEQLRAAKEATEIATRAKSEFLANMSHEIRTPITAIVGFAEMLLHQDQAQSARDEGAQTILRNAHQLLELVNEILDLSNIEAGRMTVELVATDLPSLISEVIAKMSQQAGEKGIELRPRFRHGPPLRPLFTNPIRIKQILENLVSNAIKFTHQGRVELCAFIDPADQMLCFEVSDTGIGIPADRIPHLFQPFVQVDSSTTRRFGGTGLGLTISRRLAQLLGGDISVSSVAGAGSTFTVRMKASPVKPGESVRPRKAAAARPWPDQSTVEAISGRILLAEDGRDNQIFISAMLQNAGADVMVAENGQIAVDLALAGTFDLILMDMQMPQLDGYAATKELRARGFDKPIIAVTAHAMPSDRDKCIKYGCTDYLAKPIDRNTLIAAVVHYLRQPGASTEKPDTDLQESASSIQNAGAASSICCTAPLRSTLPNDSQIQALLPTFVRRLAAQIGTIEQLLARKDVGTLENVVHQVKGSAGSYGFQCLTDLAETIESSLRQESPLQTLESEIASLVALARSVQGYDAAGEAACRV